MDSSDNSDKSKYCVQSHHEKIDSTHPDLQIYKKKTYKYDNISGVILKVRNTSRDKPFELTKKYFNKIFEGTITVTMGLDVLPPGKQTTVYIIIKDGKDI